MSTSETPGDVDPTPPTVVGGDVVRRHYVFAIRDEVPVPPAGWTISVHGAECTEARPLCTLDDNCPTRRVASVLATQVGFTDMELAFAAMSGLVDRVLQRQGDSAFADVDLSMTRLRAAAVVSSPITSAADPGEHFDRCMQLVYDCTAALLQATGYLAPPVTRQQLWPWYVVIDELEDGSRDASGIVLMEDAYLGAAFATDDQLDRAHAHLKAAWSRNPVEIYHDLRLGARRSGRAEGNYVDAVLRAAAAAETLIKHCAWQTTWEATEHLETDPAPGALRPASLFDAKPSTLIGRVLTMRLGGNWDSRTSTGPVGAWRHQVAQLRNRIIHRGHRPTEAEAIAAVDAGGLFETHLVDRLAARASTYPRAALLLVGRDALERRQMFGPARATWNNQSLDILLRDYLDWIDTHDVGASLEA